MSDDFDVAMTSAEAARQEGMQVVSEAVKSKDWPLLEATIKLLATVDAGLAQDVWDTIQAGLMIAGHPSAAASIPEAL